MILKKYNTLYLLIVILYLYTIYDHKAKNIELKLEKCPYFFGVEPNFAQNVLYYILVVICLFGEIEILATVQPKTKIL